LSVAGTAVLFAGRDLRIARSYRFPFIMTILGTVMSLITFRFIAELVGDASAIKATGDYFAFVVVGMVMAQVLERTLSGPGGSVRQEQVQGTLEVLATKPMSIASLAAGWSGYPIMESLVSAFVLVFQQAGAITRWLSAGLALISGVFFPITLFPRAVQLLAEASPLTHALRALRGTLLEGAGIEAVAGSLLTLVATGLVLLPVAIAAVGVALGRARQRGTLGTY
jgi:ABC-type polysaccharide/polyol phosphate export permease